MRGGWFFPELMPSCPWNAEVSDRVQEWGLEILEEPPQAHVTVQAHVMAQAHVTA